MAPVKLHVAICSLAPAYILAEDPKSWAGWKLQKPTQPKYLQSTSPVNISGQHKPNNPKKQHISNAKSQESKAIQNHPNPPQIKRISPDFSPWKMRLGSCVPDEAEKKLQPQLFTKNLQRLVQIQLLTVFTRVKHGELTGGYPHHSWTGTGVRAPTAASPLSQNLWKHKKYSRFPKSVHGKCLKWLNFRIWSTWFSVLIAKPNIPKPRQRSPVTAAKSRRSV